MTKSLTPLPKFAKPAALIGKGGRSCHKDSDQPNSYAGR